ncbi:hypothetical protein DAI22_04g067150 [Oryza sativa Japonica Group]|nr:hypothetical protein DAI22_04g067150 [Oryza sativa Japonica Group]
MSSGMQMIHFTTSTQTESARLAWETAAAGFCWRCPRRRQPQSPLPLGAKIGAAAIEIDSISLLLSSSRVFSVHRKPYLFQKIPKSAPAHRSTGGRRLLGLPEGADGWVYGRARPAGDLACRIGRGNRPAVGGSGRAACRSSSRAWLSRGRPSCCMLWLWLWL